MDTRTTSDITFSVPAKTLPLLARLDSSAGDVTQAIPDGTATDFTQAILDGTATSVPVGSHTTVIDEVTNVPAASIASTPPAISATMLSLFSASLTTTASVTSTTSTIAATPTNTDSHTDLVEKIIIPVAVIAATIIILAVIYFVWRRRHRKVKCTLQPYQPDIKSGAVQRDDAVPVIDLGDSRTQGRKTGESGDTKRIEEEIGVLRESVAVILATLRSSQHQASPSDETVPTIQQADDSRAVSDDLDVELGSGVMNNPPPYHL